MQKVLALCCVVIIFVISMTLVIFVPKKNVFHDVNTYYPGLLDHFTEAQLDLINTELDAEDWEDVDEDMLFTKKSSYKKIKLYENHKYCVDIKKYSQTVSIISQINGLRGAFLGMIGPQTILKVHKTDEKNMRVHIPLQKGFETVDRCGVWVKRETRNIYSNVMYDTSNIYSMYNKLRDPIKFIVLEMEWPAGIPCAKTDKTEDL